MPNEIEPARRLAVLATEIRAEVAAAEVAWSSAVAHAIAAGDKLIEAKDLAGHGNWLPWLEANFDGSERTARRYMQLAANRSRVADLPSVREAVALLTQPQEQMQMGFDEQEVRDEIRSRELIDPQVAWVGLPAFEPLPPRDLQLVLSFETEAARDEAIEMLAVVIAKKTMKTWSAWYPRREQEDLSSLAFDFDDDLAPTG